MRISEIFYSVQGEIEVGKPYVFVRFSGCNLIKENKACKFCDSLYAEEGKEMTIDEVMNEINKFKCKRVIITGGESLCQMEDLSLLIYRLYKLNYWVEIETNGTILNKELLWYVDEINCSPKKQAIDMEVLKGLMELNVRLKFVYENSNDIWWENIIKELGIDHKKIWIMAEGKTREEQISKMDEVVQYCLKNKYNFTPRLQTLIWNNRRGV